MYCIFQMSKQLFSVNDVLEYIEELDVQLLEDVDTIDVVELPPEKVDSVSDEEEFADEEELGFGESQVVSVPGFVEVSCNALDLVPTASEDSPTAQENTLQNIVDGAESGVVDPTEQQLSKKRKTSVSAKQRSKNATTQVAWNVTKNKPDCSITSNVYDPSPARENLIALHGDKTKFEIFSLMTKGVYDIMAEQSLTYAQQNNYLDFNCSVEDYMAFTGILMLSGHRRQPRQELYWSLDPNFECPLVREAMPKKRFMALKQHLHFNDNSKIPENCTDRCYKIRTLISCLNKNFMQCGYLHSDYSIDEKIVGYYGRHPIKQFIRGKPIRFGFKEWALCSSSGYTYKFSVYQGASSTPREHPLGCHVVLDLLRDAPVGIAVYFDNFFTSISLMKELTNKQFRATGTIRLNRVPNRPFGEKKELMKKPRGFMAAATDENTGVAICSWKDNKIVTVASNVHGVEPLKPAQRGARSVMMPDCIAKYNEGMLGVDLADWKTQKYRVGIKSKKWYFSICTHALDVALVNAHTIYNLMRERHEQVDLLNFRAEVTLSLLKMDTPSKPAGRGRKVVHLPQRVLMLAGEHHIERTPGGKQRKCRVCKANARKQCPTCNAGFHVDCFNAFHKQS